MTEERNIDMAKKIALAVKEKGGRAYFVGGYVRDKLQSLENKDIDIEAHGMTPETLEKVLDTLGTRKEIGKSFGVYTLCHFNIDIAMPRKETATGTGHRDFKIDIDPFIGTKKAASRRDFTVNAIMQDILTEEIIDHFGGMNDLKKGILRHVNDEAFSEDPLRVLRGAQFASRFGFEIAEETYKLCESIKLASLSSERVFDEMKKALIKSPKPSVFFEKLRKMNHLSVWFPELKNLIGVPQHTLHHKEGDVWTHTMMVLDEAAKRRDNAEKPLYFMLSALVHDFGKSSSTQFIKGNYHAYGHEKCGLFEVKSFVQRMTGENALMRYLLNMTKLHMKPNTFASDKSSIKATNKLFDEAICPNDLILLAMCDGMGKIPQKPYKEVEAFLRERLSVFEEFMSRPYVTGQDLIKEGIAPKEGFSKLLDYAHKLRLAGVSKENALSQVLKYAEKAVK